MSGVFFFMSPSVRGRYTVSAVSSFLDVFHFYFPLQQSADSGVEDVVKMHFLEEDILHSLANLTFSRFFYFFHLSSLDITLNLDISVYSSFVCILLILAS